MKLKKRLKYRFAMVIVLCVGLLFGCGNAGEIEDGVASGNSAIISSTDGMPVLSIKTTNTSGEAFLTEPISRHVAEMIASWTPGYEMPPEPYYVDCQIDLTSEGKTLLSKAEGQVKVRGNWTTSYDKKPLRINFNTKQNLLGLHDGKKFKTWVLLAEYKDGSMLRNKAALSMAREILKEDGLYASDAALVSVYVNNNYWGVYLLAEAQQVNSNRVNVTKVPDNYEGIDIGYFLEYDGYYYNQDELQQFTIDFADNASLVPFDGKGGSGRSMKCQPVNKWDSKKEVGFTIKSDINSWKQHDFIQNYVNNVYKIMYYAAYKEEAWCFTSDYSDIEKNDKLTPREAVEKVVDVKSLVDTYIISELTCDADIYWSSFYLSVDFGPGGSKKLTFQAPWDFDSGLGNKDRCADGTGFYAANVVPDVDGGPEGNGEYKTINPWLAVLVYEDWFQEMVKDKWTRHYDNKVFERTISMVQSEAEKYKDDFYRNYQRWNNIVNNGPFAAELSPQSAKCKTHKKAVEFLSEWLTNRVEFLNQNWHN